MIPRFNVCQLDRISEFFANLSVVFLASVTAPMFTGNVLNLLTPYSDYF